VRLYAARFYSARAQAQTGRAQSAVCYRRILRGGRIASLDDRQYRPVACGASHIDSARRGNGGGTGGLYSEPGVVIASGIACIGDGCIIGRQSDVGAEYRRGRAVGQVDGIAAWAVDNDTRLKRNADGGVVGTEVDVARIGARRTSSVAGGIK